MGALAPQNAPTFATSAPKRGFARKLRAEYNLGKVEPVRGGSASVRMRASLAVGPHSTRGVCQFDRLPAGLALPDDDGSAILARL
jgi:hypothetical protein